MSGKAYADYKRTYPNTNKPYKQRAKIHTPGTIERVAHLTREIMANPTNNYFRRELRIAKEAYEKANRATAVQAPDPLDQLHAEGETGTRSE